MNSQLRVMFLQARARWCQTHLDQNVIALCRRNGIDVPTTTTSGDDVSWGSYKWHLSHRLRDVDEFMEYFPEYRSNDTTLRDYLAAYDLSILPLNLLLPQGVKKFLPRLGFKPAPDPYGVVQKHSVVTRDEGGKTFYLATHKPGYASFLPILGSGAGRVSCPMGCAGCYRGPQTRFGKPLRVISADGSEQQVWIPQPELQAQWLVEEWNTRPEFSGIYDTLFSGGEPMMLPNQTWEKILSQMEQATHLRVLRICTGALFLGLPFRFDDEFVALLQNFRQCTGVQVKLSVHVSHPEHITPEAIHFAQRLIKAGIELLPQVPLEPGVNFWSEDLGKTTETLRTLDRLLAIVVGTRCYKWILDMQGGVPLCSAIEVWRRLHDSHQDESDITRPTSFALFLPQPKGNLNLSFHSRWSLEKYVDKERGVVHFRLPHPAGGWIEYNEPLWIGVNDNE